MSRLRGLEFLQAMWGSFVPSYPFIDGPGAERPVRTELSEKWIRRSRSEWRFGAVVGLPKRPVSRPGAF